MGDLTSKQPHEILLQLGGVLAVLLSILSFGMDFYGGISQGEISIKLTTFVLGLVLGAVLWISSLIARKNPLNGALTAGIVSVILLALYKDQVGTLGAIFIGGLLGIFGAVVAAISPYLPGNRHRT